MTTAEIAASAVPSLLSCDLRTLPLGRVEAFVLSQIDGSSSVDELATLAGLSLDAARTIVAKLADLGAVKVPGRAKRKKSSIHMSAVRPSRAPAPGSPSRPGDVVEVDPETVFRLTFRPTGSKSMAIGVKEGFVLGLIDGKTPASELADTLGVPFGDIQQILRGLMSAGVIEAAGGGARKARASTAPRQDSGRRSMRPGQGSSAPRASSRPERRTSLRPDVGEKKSVRPARGASMSPPRGASMRPKASLRPERPSKASVRPERASTASVRPERGSKTSLRPSRPSKTSLRPQRPDAGFSRPTAAKMQAVARATVARPPTILPGPEPGPAKPKDDDVCELDAALQVRIDDLHGRLARMTHYEILGISRDADKKAIKAAFYEHAATLHPDRHFRKKLGPYKQKLNEVFARISMAYEALGTAAKRAEYDAKLPPAPKAASAPAAAAPATAASREPGPTGRRSMRPQPVPAPAAAPPPPPADPAAAAAALAERRRAFAARLAPQGALDGSPSSGRRSPHSAAEPSTDADPQSALRRMFDTKVEHAGRKRAKIFVDAAEEALAKDDVITAATHYKLALDCYDVPELRATYEAVEEKAREKKFTVNSTLGEKAERDGRWEHAATAYGKAYAARRDGRIAERAAHAIQMHGGDLKRAVKLAEEAVLESPQNPSFRLTLGEVYAAAGMWERAQSEAERVLSGTPKDARAKALFAKAKSRS